MNSVQRPDSFEVADYTGVLRRRWWVVLGLALLGVAAAFAFIKVAPKTYSATTSVYVAPTGADQNTNLANGRTTGTVNLDTEAQIVQSGTVAKIAAGLLHSTLTPADLSKQITVTVPPNTQVLQIGCSASSRDGAVACANAFAKAYLKNRRGAATTAIKAQERAVQATISALQKQASFWDTKVRTLPAKTTLRFNAVTQLNAVRNQLNALNATQANLAAQAANSSGSYIITFAPHPTSPSSPRKLLALPSGLMAGLLLGLIGAFWLDRRDKRIHDASEVDRLLDVPVMLDLPAGAFDQRMALAPARSRTGQAFTELAHSVAATLGDGNHVVVVAGTTPGPGASVIAANLALALARTQSEVILVCADLTGTVAPGLLGLGKGRGLAEVISGSASAKEVVRGPADVRGLFVMTPGENISLAIDHLRHDTAQALMSQLRAKARYVVVEAQATDEGADTIALAEFADAAVLAVEVNRARLTDATESVLRLRRLRTPVLGAVVFPTPRGPFRAKPVRPAEARVLAGVGDPARAADAPPAQRPSEPPAQPTTTSAEPDNGHDPEAPARESHGDAVSRVPGS